MASKMIFGGEFKRRLYDALGWHLNEVELNSLKSTATLHVSVGGSLVGWRFEIIFNDSDGAWRVAGHYRNNLSMKLRKFLGAYQTPTKLLHDET